MKRTVSQSPRAHAFVPTFWRISRAAHVLHSHSHSLSFNYDVTYMLCVFFQWVFGMPLNASRGYTQREAEFSKNVMDFWTNFAKTG